MPQELKIGPYSVYFWSNEGNPLEPVHVHISEGKAVSNMPPVPGTSGGTRVAETLASFFVAEDDSMTVVPGTSGMGVRG